MVYKNCKVYGPYKRKDCRKHVIIIFPDGTRKTVSYPKYITEIRLNRYILNDRTIDHKDGNFENNNKNNLCVLPRSEHTSIDVKRLKEQKFICPECKIEFTALGKKLHSIIMERKRNKAGPFCSKRCSGIYGAKVQNKKVEKIKVNLIIPEYTSIKKGLL